MTDNVRGRATNVGTAGNRAMLASPCAAAISSRTREEFGGSRVRHVLRHLVKLYADGGYQGPKFQQGLARVCRAVNVEIVRRCDGGGFVVLPKRWIVERTIAWLNRCRRLAKDWHAPSEPAVYGLAVSDEIR